jgi:hypothetical protein
MTEMRSAGTLGDLLTSRRRRRFVGRASEIELFRIALESSEPPFSLLHVHGPAGIGKTSLLDVFAGLAADVGAIVVRLDGRDLVPSPPAVLEARLVNAYIARLHAAAAHDASLASAFVRVAGLVARPQSLLRPGVAVRVLWGACGRRRAPAVARSTGTPSGQRSPWRTAAT